MSWSAPSDLELMDLDARNLFVHDAADRLVVINDGGRRPAARFFLGRTAHGNVWRARHDLPEPLVAKLGALAEAEPVSAELERPPACLPELCAALADHGPVGDPDAGPEYRFPDELAAFTGPPVVAVTEANAGVLERWLAEWIPDTRSGLPIAAVTVEGDAVAICASVRIPGRAGHAGVETARAFRGNGYAVLATYAWATMLRAGGLIPLYGTSWANTASQRVAAKLGLRRFGESICLA